MMLKFNRYYKSPVNGDLHDQYFYHDYLIFSETDSVVRIGTMKEADEFKELGRGKFNLILEKITFEIIANCDNYTSQWSGIIKPNGIEIEIKNPDFTNVPGFYELV